MDAQAETVFVRLVIAYVFGILTFYPCTNPLSHTYLSLCCFLLFSGLLVVNLWYLPLRAYRFKHFIKMTIYLLTFSVAGMLTTANKEVLSKDYFAKQDGDFLRIRITNEPQVKNNIIRAKSSVIQSIKGHKISLTRGQLLIAIKVSDESGFKLSYGDELLIPFAADSLEGARNPFQFDTKSWLASQNIYHQTFLADSSILSVADNRGNALVSWANRLRKEQVTTYNKLLKDPEARALSSTLILGYRADLSAETLAAYSNTGTIHALSVSGMHVGLIYLVLQAALRFMDRRPIGKILKLMLILALIWFYALITGLSPSVLRAVIMLSVYVLAKTLNQQINSYNIICFSAFCMLLYNPFLLYDVGFQLSYLSVLGLVYLQPKINNWFHFRFTIFNKLWSALSLSLAAQLVTFPLATYYFHQFPVFFLVSNLFILLPMSLIMYLGILILLTRFYFLAPAFEWLIKFTNLGLEKISRLPHAVFSGIWMDQRELTLLILSTLLITFSLVYYHKKLLFSGLTVLIALLVSCAFDQWKLHDQGMLVFFSLPKNQAIAFIQDDQATLVSNLDASSSAYKFSVEPLLMHNQINRITFIDKHQTYHYKRLKIKNHQISFYGKTIFIADSCFKRKQLQTLTSGGILLLCDDSKVDMQSLIKQFPPTIVLLDGTNSPFFATKLQIVAKNYMPPAYNLKKLKAYLVNIKE